MLENYCVVMSCVGNVGTTFLKQGEYVAGAMLATILVTWYWWRENLSLLLPCLGGATICCHRWSLVMGPLAPHTLCSEFLGGCYWLGPSSCQGQLVYDLRYTYI